MTRRLLVGIGAAPEGEDARDYLVQLLESLDVLDLATGVEVSTQVAVIGRTRVRPDIAAVADVRAMPAPRPRTPAGLAESVARRIHRRLADGVHRLRTRGRRRWVQPPDCVHLNGPEAAPLLRYLRDDHVPVTTYVHSRDFNIAGLQPRDRERLIARTTRFLVADDQAAEDLVAHGVDPYRIEPAPAPLFPTPVVDPAVREQARAEAGLPPDAFVIGTPPVPDWIDGPDLTLALAWELERRRPTGAPTICWYGMPDNPEQRWPIEYDAKRMGLSTVHLVDSLPGGIDPFDLFDLYVFPSRGQTPPDLFVKYAAAHGTPVLCWSGHPLADDVRRWTDGVVAQPDVGAMADLVLRLVDDDGERSRLRLLGCTTTMAAIERLVPLQVPVL